MTGKITPVLMSGGAGTRLWPLSRRAAPKQFHRLGGDHTLIQATALRVAGDLFGPPMVVCAAPHAGLVRDQLAAVGIAPRAIITEPAPRNTGPASVAAAAYAAATDPEGLLLLVHADNLVADVAALHAAVAAGAEAARAGSIVIFGIRPTEPHTGYGYIKAAAGTARVRRVEAFVEKPDAATAARYVADPAYTWNAGMFMFKPSAFLEEADALAPALAAAARAAVAGAQRTGDLVALSAAFTGAPAEPIDTAILEKTGRAGVVAADIGWSDVGAWDALWTLSPKSASGDVVEGPGITAGTAGCLVRSDGPTVVLSGVQDLAVVVENGVVLVVPRADAAAVRAAVEAVRAAGREELL
ncbi:mannose-1-phosphate guanylyltransferase [Phenylobacterium sp.]|jgi:mannose-1-phosphate guanylyltransferase/mannose-6-phosphate isomerase|uniref:mannose-1-phosphate guanylyltransferase n=1 Tax=Phenylobacterium sp. TaxID=1871053 RepID=UPI002F42FABD